MGKQLPHWLKHLLVSSEISVAGCCDRDSHEGAFDINESMSLRSHIFLPMSTPFSGSRTALVVDRLALDDCGA